MAGSVIDLFCRYPVPLVPKLVNRIRGWPH
jgi:hypothetical protein